MTEESEIQEVSNKSPRKLLENKFVLAGAVFLICVSIGAPIGYFLMPSAPQEESASEEPIESTEHAEHTDHFGLKQEGEYEEIILLDGEEAPGAIAPLETFLVNLADEKYIRMQVQVEFNTPDVPSQLSYKLVAIRDELITHLTQQSATSLMAIQGKTDLKQVIREAINKQLKREVVRNVFFTQFVIQ